MELYARLSPTSVAAFLDLKSAFDIANREVILDQLVEFGVRGNLLRWIRGYLRNRNSRVLFKGASSTYKELELATPQGGMLSPFLFNILMHRLLTLLPDIPGTTVLCYADDTSVCIPTLLLTFSASSRLSMNRRLLVASFFPQTRVEYFLHGAPDYFLCSLQDTVSSCPAHSTCTWEHRRASLLEYLLGSASIPSYRTSCTD